MESPMEPVEYCPRHPKVETTLHCYQCGAPICLKCARRTPVGYICPDCQRGRKQRFEQSKPLDYVVAGILALVLGGIASLLPLLGWFVILLSPAAGGLIAEVVWRAVKRRYSQRLWMVVAGGIVVAAIPVSLWVILGVVAGLREGYIWALLSLLWVIIHLAMAAGAAIGRLRML